jgi:hypothetical protein
MAIIIMPVRATPRIGPTGNPKPIHDTSSTRSRAIASAAALPEHPTGDQFRRADEQERREQRRRRLEADASSKVALDATRDHSLAVHLSRAGHWIRPLRRELAPDGARIVRSASAPMRSSTPTPAPRRVLRTSTRRSRGVTERMRYIGTTSARRRSRRDGARAP